MIESFLATMSSAEQQVSFSQLLKPGSYCLAALPLFYLGTSRVAAQVCDARVGKVWLILSGLYLLVATNVLLQGDVEFILWVRPIFKENHWYEYRRFIQIAVMAAVCIALVTWLRRRRWSQRDGTTCSCPYAMLKTAAAGTAGVYFLKFISFHYTDILLNALWLNHSSASWAELGFVCMVGLGTVGALAAGARDV